MLGFILGVVTVVALVAARRASRFWRFGRGARGGFSRFGGFGHHGGRPRWLTRRLFSELGTTQSQEKVILEAIDEVRGEGRKLRDEAYELRTDLGAVLAADVFDAARLEAAFGRQEGVITALRERLTSALAKVHATLEPDQRRRLVRLIEQGPHGRWRGRADAPGFPA